MSRLFCLTSNSPPKVGVKQPPVAFSEYSGAAKKEPVTLSEHLRQVAYRPREYESA